MPKRKFMTCYFYEVRLGIEWMVVSKDIVDVGARSTERFLNEMRLGIK